MNILDVIVGKPLKTSEERAEQIGVKEGVPIFGLDALSSAAYGPEAALSLLNSSRAPRCPVQRSNQHSHHHVARHCLLLLPADDCRLSHRRRLLHRCALQSGRSCRPSRRGGSVDRLHPYRRSGDLCRALVSAVPSLQPHTVSLCLGILVVVTILNLRGVRDAGLAFMLPTYLFVATLMITIAGGVIRVYLSGGHPVPVAPLPAPPLVTEAVTYWLLLKVFASGCTALTGVEAVSNGVKAFREPAVKNAQRTLTVIIFFLAMLLAGISYLVKSYGIVATDPGKPGYQSVLSMLIGAVFGKGVFYYLTIAAILFVLSLSANTAFADFPRLCSSIAQNNFLPHAFRHRGRRLVYSYGIIVLGILTFLLLILFGGITDKLIPLYAVGAFLAFTLSQFGMVQHWRKNRGAGWVRSALVNGLGGFVTGVTVIVVLVAKFVEGAWITVIFIPSLILFFRAVRRHYHMIHIATSCPIPVVPAKGDAPPIVVVPVDHWSCISKQALEFASRLSPDIIAIHVELGEHGHSEFLQMDWECYVIQPFRGFGLDPPELVLLPSP